MKKTLLAALLLAAAPFAAAEENLSGPLPNIHFSPFISTARPLAAGPGQQAPLDIEIQNPMFGVGQIFVPCGFDGQNDKCLLDTGAAICLVTNDAFFGKYPSQGQSCTGGASGQRVCNDLIGIGDLKVGDVDFGKEEAQRRSSAQSCGGDSGGPSLPSYLVGSVWHSLLGHQVAFNFDAKTLSVDSAVSTPGGSQPMKLILDNTFLLVPAAFGSGAPVQLLYDTGAGLSVLDQSFVDANAGAFQFLADTQIMDSSCAKIPAKVYQVNAMSVAGQSVPSTLAVGLDLTEIKKVLGKDVQGIIGFNAIDKFNWSVDLKNNQFSITPAQSGSVSVASVEPLQIPKVLKLRLPSLLQRAN